MQKRFVIIVAMSLALSVPGLTKDKGSSDAEKIQGTWSIVSAEHNGKHAPEDKIKDTRVVITEDRIIVREKSGSEAMTYQLHSDKNPPTIDMTMTKGPEKGKTAKGIYRLKGNQLTVCFTPPGKGRPSKFSTKSDSGQMLFEMKRVSR